MRNKGIIRAFAIAMALVCLYQLLFTWKTTSIEKEAKVYADGDYSKENEYLDSISNVVVYNFLGLRQYTYKECKEREINLGLDLKGGMNVMLEVSVADVIRALSNYSTDPVFQQAMARATQLQQTSQDDFITLFGQAFGEIAPNAQLTSIFMNSGLGSKINYSTSNEEVLRIIRLESESAIANAFRIIHTRIDRFGVIQPNVQQLEPKSRGRILVELPGIKEPERVRKLLQGSANLEFWAAYDNPEMYPYFIQANEKIREMEAAQSAISQNAGQPSAAQPEVQPQESAQDTASQAANLLERLSQQTPDAAVDTTVSTVNPLFAVLKPYGTQEGLIPGSTVGLAQIKDTAKVNRYLKICLEPGRNIFPQNVRFLWSIKPYKDESGRETDLFELYAIKTGRDNKPLLDGSVIETATADFDQQGGSAVQVSMSMDREGTQEWARITRDNVGKSIAIVLDNNVYSAPRVQNEIPGGNSQITGNFTMDEATDLANVLKSGKMPASARIIQDEVVGPTLGKESIRAGFLSFILALIVVMVYLAFYYSRGGVVADVALLVNMFFLIGVLASLGAVLTLPGIAGIVLTLGMADDANIIIFERIREELRAGKGMRLAISDGYKHAYSAIIDGNVTTFLTGVVLFFFGTGPIQGFATTLVLGILTSLFCSIFISRLLFEWMLDRNMALKFSIPATAGIFANANFDFIGVRKKLYVVSIAVILIGVSSMFIQGFNYGIDFIGGRSYTVRFDESVNTVELQSSLRQAFDNNAPEVKTFGSDNQVKVTTDYLQEEEEDISSAYATANVDSIVEARLYAGSKFLLKDNVTIEQFRTDYLMTSQKIGAGIADDIKHSAFIAVFLALLVIFLYIFFRFRNWKFGLSAILSLLHDSLIMIGLYSLLYKIVPFSLEVDQQFIAAILTVIGYSINDTVIIYDRIREYTALYPKRPMRELYNTAINSTLGRTMNTSCTTMFVLLIIFIFGGEIIRGFSFAMLVGIMVGTYSSVFNAAPIAYDLFNYRKKKK